MTASRQVQKWEPPAYESCSPSRLSGYGARDVRHTTRLVGVLGAMVPIIVAAGVLGTVPPIPTTPRRAIGHGFFGILPWV